MSDLDEYLNRMMNNFNSVKLPRSLSYPYSSKAVKNQMNIYMDVLRETSKVDIRRFYHFVGLTFYVDPSNYLGRIYEKFNRTMEKTLSYQQMIDMESYILQNFTAIQGERYITGFSGILTQKITTWTPRIDWKGRIFLTNYRFIVCGKIFIPGPGGAGVPTELVGTVGPMAKITQKIEKKLDGSKENFLPPAPNFGFQIQVYGGVRVRKNSDNIHFTVNLAYETDKGKSKERTLTFVIKPKKGKGEPNTNFNARKQQNLDIVYKTLCELNKLPL